MSVPMKMPAQGDIMESVLIKGDLAKLTSDERVRYYGEVCRSVGLNPLTKPFEFITLNGKMVLYALRTCADQLRKINGVTLEIVSREVAHDILTVHVRARLPDGRADEDLGTVSFPDTLKGEARANAELKAVTKAKRRATLSICGLGWLDETEIADIPAAAKRPVAAANAMLPAHDATTGEVVEVTVDPSPSRQVPSTATNSAGATSPDAAPADLSSAEYCAHWNTIIASATNAQQLGKAWNDDKAKRDAIDWPDDGSFAALRSDVAKAVDFLKK